MAQLNRRNRRGRGKRLRLAVAVLVLAALVVTLALGLFLSNRSRSARELFEEGQRAFNKGNYQDAVNLYSEGLKKMPESSEGYNLLGMAYRFQANQTDDAGLREKEVAAFREAVRLAPEDPTPYVNLGATLFYMGKTAEAATYLKKALELYPDHPDRADIERMIRQAESTR